MDAKMQRILTANIIKVARILVAAETESAQTATFGTVMQLRRSAQ